MKTITSEWIAKAEADFATAKRELGATENPNHDAVCFHAQQCVEKYFKAFLQESNIAFPKTHDLAALLSLAITIEPTWSSMTADLNTLSAFASSTGIPENQPIRMKPKKRFKSARMFVKYVARPFNCR